MEIIQTSSRVQVIHTEYGGCAVRSWRARRHLGGNYMDITIARQVMISGADLKGYASNPHGQC